MEPDQAAALRRPFEPSQIGKLPRGGQKDSRPIHCRECNGTHAPNAIHLDYVGHAAVTDRLLSVDPEWWWEPMAFDDAGLPAVRVVGDEATLWIRLTVLGVERIGVGVVREGTFELDKQLISDAIRNAGMRFGVGLDLWSKQDLGEDDTETHRPAAAARKRLPESLEALDRANLLAFGLSGVAVGGGDDADPRPARPTSPAPPAPSGIAPPDPGMGADELRSWIERLFADRIESGDWSAGALEAASRKWLGGDSGSLESLNADDLLVFARRAHTAALGASDQPEPNREEPE